MKFFSINVILLCFLLIIFFTGIVMAEPLSDISDYHWAFDSINLLQEKGLIEGYPDGFFKGDRPVTRYEMAMVLAKVVAKLQQIESSVPEKVDMSIYISKDEMNLINVLLKEFNPELTALGVKVVNIEDSLEKLNDRISGLEKFFVAGDITVVTNALGFTKEPVFDPNSPYTTPMVFEEYAGFGLTQGSDISTKLNLDLGVNINENIVAGGTFVGYNYFGNPEVTYFWGILPQFSCSGISVNNMFNTGLNFQSNLNKLWFKSTGDWEVNGTFGEYQPEKISPLVYYGVVGPSAWCPDSVPIYGINFNGKLYGKYKFEVFQADDLTWTGAPPTHVFTGESPYDLFQSDYYQTPDNIGYHSRMYSMLGGYEGEKFDFDTTYMRIYEDRASRPTSPLIPRDEIVFDLRGNYQFFEDKLKFCGEFARSWFDYNLLDSAEPSRPGNAIILGAEGIVDKIGYEAKFIRIDGNYEPFNFRKIFTNTYEGAYIMSYYTANRTGGYGRVKYSFEEEKGSIDGGIGYLKQLDPTMDTIPETTIGGPYGYQDHYFHNNSIDKGREFQFDFGGSYTLTDNLLLEGRLLSINFYRIYPLYIHDETRNFIYLSLKYNITDKFSIAGSYKCATMNGIDDDGLNSDILLNIPGLALNYHFSDDTEIGLHYRYYNHNDNVNIDNDYNLNRVTTYMTLKF